MRISRRALLVGVSVLGGVLGFEAAGQKALAAELDGVLRLPLARPAGNLDPQRYVGVFAVQDMIFDPLVEYKRGGKLVPGLAESWTVSEDGKKITLKLRPNVTFTDGTPWDADAAIWNLERWAPKANYNWLRTSANWEKVEKIDPLTIAIHLKAPTPTAFVEFSYVRPVRFLSPKAVGPDGAYKDPIGTGPWMIKSDKPEGTTLVPNPKYWGEKTALKQVDLVVIPDARSRMSALRGGDIDATGGSLIANVSPQEARTLTAAGVKVVTDTGTDTMILGFNPKRPMFQDARVREAFNLLIDRKGIANALLLGYATPTMNLYPEVIAYSGKRYDVPDRNLARAKQLLDEAGWKGESGTRMKDGKPLKVELVISEDAVAGSRALGEVLQNMFSEAGIDLSLRNVDHAVRHGDIPQFNYDISLFVTNGAPYDPFNTLVQGFLSTLPPGTDGKIFMDEKFDPLVVAAVGAAEKDRPEKFQAAYDWLRDNWAIAPIYHTKRVWAHGDRVKDFAIPATEYEMPLEGLRLQ